MALITVKTYQHPHSIPALPLMAWDVTPNDDNDYEQPVTVMIKVAGAVKVTPWAGSNTNAQTAITIPADVAVAGYILPFRVRRIYDTDTDATIIGIF